MGREISLFSGYEQRENRTTNYVLLMLKLVYEESPALFAEVLGALAGRDLGDEIGVAFRQQEKKGSSIPDGLIFQRPVAIYIEAKLGDWHYEDQLARQAKALDKEQPGLKVLVALANFEIDLDARFATIQQKVDRATKGRVAVGGASYESPLIALRSLNLSATLKATVEDFGAYLDSAGLLPSWKMWLDVVNSASTRHEFEDGVYLCPLAGGAYQHSRARFMGMYAQKTVSLVAEVEGLVELHAPDHAEIRWQNNPAYGKTALMNFARELFEKHRPGQYPHRAFVLGPRYETDFQKDTPGGMLGSKRYFAVKSESVEDLAEQLRGRTWSSWG